MNLTLAITTHNRFDLLLKSFAKVVNNDRITEIIILDDCSDRLVYDSIAKEVRHNEKVKLFRQAKNRGMSRNKADAISYALNEWVIILDSDNVIDYRYIDAIPLNLTKDVIYCPDFAEPAFDYRKFGGHEINLINLPNYIYDKEFNMLLNTCNYVVNRDAYLKVYKENPEMKATDTKWFAYLWLQAGGTFKVMKDCPYYHRVHKDSGFMADVAYNMAKDRELTGLIKTL